MWIVQISGIKKVVLTQFPQVLGIYHTAIKMHETVFQPLFTTNDMETTS